MAQQPDTIVLRGGLDLVSPGMLARPGFCIAAKNYEVEARGYRRMAGYEPFDGRASPNDAFYHALFFEGARVIAPAGTTIVGATSGATGVALTDSALDEDSPDYADQTWGSLGTLAWNALPGPWDRGTAHGHVALMSVAGTFIDGEPLDFADGTPFAYANGMQVRNGAPTPELNAHYLSLAAETERTLVGRPPGSGPIRGIATLRGSVYAWRDNDTGTAGQMFRATSTGWQVQSFGRTLAFHTGTAEIREGQTISNGTGASATVQRIVRKTGSWGTDAAGFIVLSDVAGAFASGDALTTPEGGAATAGAADEEIILPPGGKYRSMTHNFFGQASTERLYVANGVGRAFEWDGAVLAPIDTGLSSVLDRPTFVAVQNNHLFLGFDRGGIISSEPGEPLLYDGALGAVEFGLGQEITGMQSFTMDSLVIAGRNRVGYLVGTDAANFDLRIIAPRSGAIEDTLAVIDSPHFMDDQGVRSMQAAETFGDWQIATTTSLVEPLVRRKRETGVRPVGALAVRAKTQYRLFYGDGSGLVVYFGRENPEIMPFEYPFTPTALHAGENADGDEMLFAGSDDGWVYRLDRGASFAGEEIDAFMRLAFLNQRRPNQEKRYHRAIIEGNSEGQATAFSVGVHFDYADSRVPAGAPAGQEIGGGGEYWTEAYWENPLGWGTEMEGRAIVPLDGIGFNVSLLFHSRSMEDLPHTLSAITINWTPRRRLR